MPFVLLKLKDVFNSDELLLASLASQAVLNWIKCWTVDCLWLTQVSYHGLSSVGSRQDQVEGSR